MKSWDGSLRRTIATLLLVSLAFAVGHLTPLQRVLLRGDHIFGMQLYQGSLYGASPDYTPVPDVPCIVIYRPDQGLREVCVGSLFGSGGVIEDLVLLHGELYGSARGHLLRLAELGLSAEVQQRLEDTVIDKEVPMEFTVHSEVGTLRGPSR